MCKSVLEYADRALSEPFKYMMGTFTWECRYSSQSLSYGNYLLRSSTDILIWDFGDAFLGKSFKKSLEGSKNSVTDGRHFIKCILKISTTTLFVEIQLIKLINSLDKEDITGNHHKGLSQRNTCKVICACIVKGVTLSILVL
jgi:hypothetical protein